jgi:alpha-tubulin suppressor-like RCC1 family protein
MWIRCGVISRLETTTLRTATVFAAFASVLALDGCSSDAKPTEPAPAPVPSMVAVSVLTQEATVDHPVPSNPTVRVTDAAGQPVPGLNVQFNTGGADSPPVTTGADGTASTTWKLGRTAGQQTMAARLFSAKSVALGPEVTFSATALPDTLTSIQAFTVLNQVGFASQTAAIAPIVVAVDEFSNPKSGIAVTFAVAGAGGSVTPSKVVTDANGQARATLWTLGDSVGVDTVVVQIPGAAPVYFTDRVSPPFVATSVVTGLQHTCALALGGDVYCWGVNKGGQVKPGDPSPFWIVPQRVPLSVKAVSISSGYSHTCAISNETPPQAYCWGDNTSGQLGVADPSVRSGPVKVPVPDGLASVATGAGHSCGLTPAGVAYCWGDGTFGELGNGEILSCYVPQDGGPVLGCGGPTPVAGVQRFVALAAGVAQTCGLLSSGQLYCWGLNDAGQLGSGSKSPCSEYDYYYSSLAVPCALTPQAVSGSTTFISVATGSGTCALTAGNALACLNTSGAQVAGNSLTLTSLAPDGECGVASNAMAYCWTSGFDVPTAAFPQFAPVGGGLAVTAITATQMHRCAILKSTGAVACWGSNDVGQLGNGTTGASTTPSPVIGPPPAPAP